MSAPEASRRLFFALWPTPPLAQAVSALGATYNATPAHREDLHLTVLFLGTLADSQVAELMRAAARIRNPVIHQPLTRLERWSGAGVVCLAGDPVEALAQLRRSIQQAASQAGIDPEREPLEFRPHLTLRRGSSPDARAALPAIAPMSLIADQFHLAESAPRAAGPRYRQLASWPLG